MNLVIQSIPPPLWKTRNEGPDDEHVENDTICDDGHARTYFVNAAENFGQGADAIARPNAGAEYDEQIENVTRGKGGQARPEVGADGAGHLADARDVARPNAGAEYAAVDEHIVNINRGTDGQAGPEVGNSVHGAGQEADTSYIARPNAGADKHQQVLLGEGVIGKHDNRRKSVGERIQEFECLNVASTVKANGIADRLPSLKKGNGVADMLPTKITWSEDDEKAVRKMSKRLVHKKWEIVQICLNFIEENNEIVSKEIEPERKDEKYDSLERR